jgi:hypothetical protein
MEKATKHRWFLGSFGFLHPEIALRKLLALIILAVFSAGIGFAYDFGAVLEEAQGASSEDGFSFNLSAGPWFSTPLGEKANLYVSGSFAVNFEDNAWDTVPQINRTELLFHPTSALLLQAGRIGYADSLGIIASGLFDGVQGSLGVRGTRFSLGCFYTGFLYKKSAEITLTGEDALNYADPDVYGASRRLVAALKWEIPELLHSPVAAVFDGLMQMDLNGGDQSLNSQYLTAKFMIPLIPGLNADLAVALGYAEPDGEDAVFSIAGAAGAAWMPPTKAQDLFSFNVLWSSGSKGDALGPFLPITGTPQGKIFSAKFSGLMVIKGAYTLSLDRTLSVSADAGYYLRTDLKTFYDSRLDYQSDSHTLGGELYGTLLWAPFSDISVILGGGAFFPGLGKAFESDTPVRGQISMGLIFSF